MTSVPLMMGSSTVSELEFRPNITLWRFSTVQGGFIFFKASFAHLSFSIKYFAGLRATSLYFLSIDEHFSLYWKYAILISEAERVPFVAYCVSWGTDKVLMNGNDVRWLKISLPIRDPSMMWASNLFDLLTPNPNKQAEEKSVSKMCFQLVKDRFCNLLNGNISGNRFLVLLHISARFQAKQNYFTGRGSMVYCCISNCSPNEP